MKANKNKIFLVGESNCDDCSKLYEAIYSFLEENNIDLTIEKIDASSDEAIEISIELDINTIPFAFYGKNTLVYGYKLDIGKLIQCH